MSGSVAAQSWQRFRWVFRLQMLFGLWPYQLNTNQATASANKNNRQRRRQLLSIGFSTIGLCLTIFHIIAFAFSYLYTVMIRFNETHGFRYSIMATMLSMYQRRIVSGISNVSTVVSLVQLLWNRKLLERIIVLFHAVAKEMDAAGLDTSPIVHQIRRLSAVTFLGLLIFLGTQIYHEMYFFFNGSRQSDEDHQQSAPLSQQSLVIIMWCFGMPIVFKQIQICIFIYMMTIVTQLTKLLNENLLLERVFEVEEEQSMWEEEEQRKMVRNDAFKWLD